MLPGNSKKISSSFKEGRNGFEPWRIEGGEGEEETPLIRPISKNIPIVHDETRFRSLTFFFLFFFFFSIPLLLDIFPKIPFINSKNQASQNFTNLYLRINRKI